MEAASPRLPSPPPSPGKSGGSTGRSAASSTTRPAAGSPAAKAAADLAAAAIVAGRRLQAAREGRDARKLGLAHAAVAEQRRLQLAVKRPESGRVLKAMQQIQALEADIESMREAEERAADVGGEALLKAVELQRKRVETVERIKVLKTERLAMMLEDETGLRDAERQQHALEKLELEYVELKSAERYAEAYQLSLALRDLRVRLAALWRELTTGQLSEALMGMGVGAADAEDVEAGMQPTIPAPFSFADHATVLLAAINKSRRKIKTLERTTSGRRGWISADDGGEEAAVVVNPHLVLDAERSKLLALQTRLAERYASKSKRDSALRPSPCGFGISASRFSAEMAAEGSDSLSEEVFKEVLKGAAAAAAAAAAAQADGDGKPPRKKKGRRTKRARRVRRRRRPLPPGLMPSSEDAAGGTRATAVRLGAGSLSPFGFASATPTYRGAASKGVPWGIKEIDRPSLIRDHTVGQPAPRALQSQQYAALLLDPEFRPGERPRCLFPETARPAMGVLFKEHAVLTTAGKSKAAGQRSHSVYTWNPAPAGVTGVDVSHWAADGSRIEDDAVPAKPKVTKPMPSWAWPGGDGRYRDGLEQWETDMGSVVDEMFEAAQGETHSTADAAGGATASAGKAPPPSASAAAAAAAAAAAEGGSARGSFAKTAPHSARDSFGDASLLGRSRVAAGVVGVRRRNGTVKRGGGLPPLPFIAYTLLRQEHTAEEDFTHASGLGSAASSVAMSPPGGVSQRTLLLPDPGHQAQPQQQQQAQQQGQPGPSEGPRVATAWTDQSRGDGWFEDVLTVVWHVAVFEDMAYSKQHSLRSTKELGFAEMSFMRSPKLSAYERRSLAADNHHAAGAEERAALSPRGALAVSDMMTCSAYYRYSARKSSNPAAV